jgi:integrase
VASIRARKETGKLYIDFRLDGARCREQTNLDDTPANRKTLEKLVMRMERDMADGTFVYRNYFPNGKLISTFPGPNDGSDPVAELRRLAAEISAIGNGAASPVAPTPAPIFKDFAGTWFGENAVGWRKSYRVTIRDILDKHLMPAFGDKVVNEIQKAEILGFRSVLAKIPGRKNKESLSASRINYIMMALRQILEEAADRFGFTTPYRKIKALKIQKTDVQPFSLAEVQKILETVRMDYRNYLTVRFYTGMRTGEIDGLKWQYVDFDARQILVRETIVAGEEEYTKTDASQREIRMTDAVLTSLRSQEKVSRGKSEFVFINEQGRPLDKNNFTRRVWRPLLRHLGLKLRRPYHMRHTAATLWLAAGENPQWIARQLGHASTEMLFRIYARFVPNNTRQDGSAFERLLRDSATRRAGDTDTA